MSRPNGEPAPSPTAKDARSIILSIKGTLEYREWVNALAAHNRTTSVNIMDLALVHYAKHTKFPEPAPPRNRSSRKIPGPRDPKP